MRAAASFAALLILAAAPALAQEDAAPQAGETPAEAPAAEAPAEAPAAAPAAQQDAPSFPATLETKHRAAPAAPVSSGASAALIPAAERLHYTIVSPERPFRAILNVTGIDLAVEADLCDDRPRCGEIRLTARFAARAVVTWPQARAWNGRELLSRAHAYRVGDNAMLVADIRDGAKMDEEQILRLLKQFQREAVAFLGEVHRSQSGDPGAFGLR